MWQNDKHNGLNLTHVKTDLNKIEFRIFNGTISFPVWMQNIKFLGRLMMVSKRLSSIYEAPHKLEQTLKDLKQILLMKKS